MIDRRSVRIRKTFRHVSLMALLIREFQNSTRDLSSLSQITNPSQSHQRYLDRYLATKAVQAEHQELYIVTMTHYVELVL